MADNRIKVLIILALSSLLLISTGCGGAPHASGTTPGAPTTLPQASRPTPTHNSPAVKTSSTTPTGTTTATPPAAASSPTAALPPIWETSTPSLSEKSSETPTPSAIRLPSIQGLSGGTYLLYLTQRATSAPKADSLIAFSPTSKLDVDLSDNFPASALATSRLSGDKTRLAYLENSRLLVILDLNQHTSNSIQLDRDCSGLSLSPKGDQLLMACGDIYLYTLATQKWQALTTSTRPQEWSAPAWSPDGKWLAYIHPATSIPPQRPTSTPTVSYKTKTPQPSPIPPVVKDPLDGLYLVNTTCLNDPSTCKSFTNFVQAWLYAPAPPAWSPDSLYVAFYDMGTIMMYNSVGEYRGEIDLPELQPTDGWNYQPIVWSPDGQWMALSGAKGDSKSQLSLISVKAQSIHQMVTGDSPINLIDWFALPTFAIGQSYTVSMAGDTLHVHDTPSIDGVLIRRLKHGDTFTVLEGPVYAEGYIWWKIQEKIELTQGWIVENPDWVVNVIP